MGKKKASKKKVDKEKKSSTVEEPKKDETFDFGGLPARNLKKNLGCG